jgi:hypothetical protein
MYNGILIVLLVALSLLIAYILPGCASGTEFKTEVTGSTVHQATSFDSRNSGTSHKKHTSVTISPSSIMTSSPSVAPVPPVPIPTITPPTTQPTVVQVDGKVLTAPVGMSVSYTVDEEDRDKPSTSVSSKSNADGAGASIRSVNDVGNFKSDAPSVSMKPLLVNTPDGSVTGGGGESDGGDASFAWTTLANAITPPSARGERSFWLAGLLFMVGGGLYVVVELLLKGVPDYRLVIVAEVIGLGLLATAITAEQHPIVFLFLFFAIVAVIVWYVWEWKRKEDAAKGGTTTPSTTPSIVSSAESELSKLQSYIAGLFHGQATAKNATPATAAPTAATNAAQATIEEISQIVNRQ